MPTPNPDRRPLTTLNDRLGFCAEHGIPYNEKVWLLLCAAWREGYIAAAREYERDDLEPGETPCGYDGRPWSDGVCRHPSEVL